MPNFLRLLLLASTVLSLLTARWAYVRGQAQQERSAAARLVLMATNVGPQWLPGASWQSWPTPATYYTRQPLAVGAAVSEL